MNLTHQQAIVLAATRSLKSSYQGRNPRIDEARRICNLSRADFLLAQKELIDLRLLNKNTAINEDGKATIGWIDLYKLRTYDEPIPIKLSQTFALSPNDFKRVISDAHKAGMAAVESLHVTPMVVEEHAHPLDDNSPVVQSYFVEEGVCGFAWVRFRPANSTFAKWLHNNYPDETYVDSYAGGLCYSIHDFRQSLQRKSAYAGAFARSLSAAGINCHAESRID
jgi:hypothetical protein